MILILLASLFFMLSFTWLIVDIYKNHRQISILFMILTSAGIFCTLVLAIDQSAPQLVIIDRSINAMLSLATLVFATYNNFFRVPR